MDSRSDSLKAAQKRYARSLKRVEIQFSASELPLYNKLQKRAFEEGKRVTRLIKEIIAKWP